MTWDEIIALLPMINRIAAKYSGNTTLQEDVVGEVVIKLIEDKNLDVNKFDPAKKDAAIRNVIRNKVITVLQSKTIGRWPFESLDYLNKSGFQVDDNGSLLMPPNNNTGNSPDLDEGEEK